MQYRCSSILAKRWAPALCLIVTLTGMMATNARGQSAAPGNAAAKEAPRKDKETLVDNDDDRKTGKGRRIDEERKAGKAGKGGRAEETRPSREERTRPQRERNR